MANNKNKKKPIRISFGVSWIYFILLFGIAWMFFKQGGSNPQKEEWADVQAQWLAGDIKEITFIRNEYEGQVTIRPERLEKYADKFGGEVPKKSPHFVFLVSGSFNAEEMFGNLNAQLPESHAVKVVIENRENYWSFLEWIIFPVILLIFWFFMFRGMNKGMGGGPGGPGGIFNVGKSTGKLAEKDSITVTFKDVAGLYGAKEEVMEIVDFLKNPKKYTALGGKRLCPRRRIPARSGPGGPAPALRPSGTDGGPCRGRRSRRPGCLSGGGGQQGQRRGAHLSEAGGHGSGGRRAAHRLP